jgi:hypothetical protein
MPRSAGTAGEFAGLVVVTGLPVVDPLPPAPMIEEPASLTAARQLAEESRAGQRRSPRRLAERRSDPRRLRQSAVRGPYP